MSLTSWFLVSSGGTRHRLPREMIFVGRDDCELMLQSRSVDKQHAVINYESSSDQHKVKDLGSLNGTFVNDVRIQEQMYITLKIDDKLRFGYDTNLFTVVRGELHVPEEALKHEKFTSQLQLGKKPTCAEPSKTPKSSPDKAKVSKPAEPIAEPAAKPAEPNKGDDKMPVTGDIAAVHRGTPLYGQPSWWGDGDADDENSFKQENKTSGKKPENSGAESKETKRGDKSKENGLGPVGAEPSYFEIPSKEGQMAQNSIHEIPTKDTEGTGAAKSATANAAAQANTSFTIEFDDTSPGKVTIKDHVSRPRPKKSPHVGGKDLSTLQAAIMASESKVADWLAQNDPPLVRRESTEEDNKSIKSDVPVHLKRLKGSKHEDGTQSDSENGLGLRFGSKRHAALEERLRAAGVGRVKTEGSSSVSRTSFMIEFYDEDNPRKRRSYSFSQTSPLLGGVAGEGFCPAPPSRPKVVATAADGSKGMSSSLAAVAPTAARLLLKQRSEEPKVVQSPAATGQPSPTDEAQKQDDDQSDKGTYTIELDKSNPEEEEARRMIDKVFGVEDSQNPGCPEQREASGKVKDSKKLSSTVSERLVEDSVAVGSPRWVSQWASLAANQTRTDPEGSGAEPPAFVHQERDGDAFEAGISIKSTGSTTSSQAERKRRTLPQLPTEDKIKRSEIGEKQDTEPQEKESHNDHKGDGECIGTPDNKDVVSSQSKSIQQDGKAGKQSSVHPLGSGERRSSEESRRRRSEGKSKGSDGERSGKPLVRQGSFTIEKPSGNVPIELIPRINRQNGGRERSDSVGSMDTATLLKDTEAVMAFLEAKLRDEKKLDPVTPPACPLSPESDIDTASTVSQAAAEGDRKVIQKRRSLSSLYREKSNASTTSKTTTSARERLERKTKTKTTESRSDTRRSVQTASRSRQPSQDLTDDDQTSSLAISDILSSDQETYSSRSHTKGHFTSTDDLLQSKLDTSKSTRSAKPSKTLQTSTTALAKQAGLPQPRPTRASMLRRARLGDTSDTDLADADRVSVASEVSTTSSTSKPPLGRKAQSRIDLLAQPRRTRLGSFSARSDSEATVSRTTATRVSAETALRLGLRSTNQQAPDSKLTARMRANSVSKLTDPKPKTAPINSIPSETQLEPESILAEEEPMASNRWRRLPPEYASTSEDEFGSNRNSPKHIHLRPGTTLRTSRLGCPAPVTTSPGGLLLKNRMREQEEYIRDWTAHSEEIARISQDLAKDLAILAREIHDVAGEIDSVSSSGTAPSTTVSTAATTPGSAIDTKEELVERVFDESLNFRKIPPVVHTKASEINGRPVELRPRAPDSLDPQVALRRRTWNRDEVRPAVLDSLLLTSVSQLSSKIRQSVDKTTGKIRILFKDKDRNWDDIESKLCLDNEVPLPKTTNKEISSILTELKRVEKQLQVINIMVDPDGTLDALTSLSLTSPTTPKPRSSPGSQSVWGPLPSNGAPQPPPTTISSGPEKPSVGHNFHRTHLTGEESAIASK
ncbi:centrosomal protein of 170 kDa-like isoform X4 [Cyprinus carpio]|uniref:Centrosomal protein of 170 kDa-like isoform X4 n=1 Tax=Cyprinus carpio TaxID=7962 RepID=A0A9Q9WZV9_CYPCA|nr:centrosomal protein of 170 kDa-like isoform X4 [Cyprinus carpio]